MSFSKLKMTEYFRSSLLRRRPEFSGREDDIIEWMKHPSRVEIQTDGRKKLHAWDAKVSKWVRIIVLEDEETIHNIFYDRNFKG